MNREKEHRKFLVFQRKEKIVFRAFWRGGGEGGGGESYPRKEIASHVCRTGSERKRPPPAIERRKVNSSTKGGKEISRGLPRENGVNKNCATFLPRERKERKFVIRKSLTLAIRIEIVQGLGVRPPNLCARRGGKGEKEKSFNHILAREKDAA